MTKQLYKLIDVLKVQELGPTAVELELMMIKVISDPTGGRRSSRWPRCSTPTWSTSGPEAITFSCVAQPDRLQALEELLAPYGIRELVRTGRIALDRDGELGTRKRMRVVA